MDEAYAKLATLILNFVRDSEHKMRALRINKEDLRIAFPEYLKKPFMKGMVNIYGASPSLLSDSLLKIQEIETHPTWENKITIYYIHSLSLPEYNFPAFHLHFDRTSEPTPYGFKHTITPFTDHHRTK